MLYDQLMETLSSNWCFNKTWMYFVTVLTKIQNNKIIVHLDLL